MKVTAWRVVLWVQVLGFMMVMACRLEYIIQVAIGDQHQLLAVYDIFTLVVASQAYAITIKGY